MTNSRNRPTVLENFGDAKDSISEAQKSVRRIVKSNPEMEGQLSGTIEYLASAKSQLQAAQAQFEKV